MLVTTTACASSRHENEITCVQSMNLPLEEPARVSHRKVEAQSLLTHEIRHSVVPQHTRSESENPSGRVDCLCCLGESVGIEEVAS